MTASTRDLQFALHDVLDYTGHYQRLFGNEAPTRELMDAITDEAARFCEGELAPLNRFGDEAGCTFADGVVTAPAGFKAAYEKYVEGGWAGLCGAPEYGGQGLPDSLGLVLENLLVAANPAWTMYPALSRGVVEALEHHGSEEQKTQFLPKLLAGEWTGTMCLTEPHAGSDVGLARTKAEVQADGSYLISGTKIFISAGEHDLSDNIVHLVLARTLEAPEGTRGISMFVVPKFNLDGSRNGVVCGGIEEKMGIHGNATCMLHFEAARGYLVGEENQGMRNMFTMMNAARIVVGLQGVGQAESSLQSATVYAQERLQMRSLSGPKAPDEVADPIIVHPDVRRMLLTQRAIVDGGRVLVYLTGQVADTAAAGVLYEGTTGIQALDLLGRKILQTQGPGLKRFIAMMNELADELEDHSDEFLAGIAPVLRHHAEEWDALATMLMGKAMENLDEVGAAAVDFLFYSGYLCLAYCWARIAQAAGSGPAEDPYLESKLAAARFYFARMLPRVLSHKTAIEAGADTLMSGSAESFGPF
jgi:alkylation response protein AidB-like acyl-CoA dehydrogenase